MLRITVVKSSRPDAPVWDRSLAQVPVVDEDLCVALDDGSILTSRVLRVIPLTDSHHVVVVADE